MRTMMRRLAITAALVLSLGTVAACGDDEPAGGSSGGGTADGAFPVTITHKLGTATIESEPKRIVALGEVDQDTLLALGITPVGMAELTGVQPDGLAPWTAPKLTGEKPLLAQRGRVQPGGDRRAAARPHPRGRRLLHRQGVRQALQAGADRRLRDGPGRGLLAEDRDPDRQGRRQGGRGRKIVAEVDGAISGVQTKYPQLKGTGFAFTSVFPNGNIGVMKSKDDTSVKLLEQFGLKLPEQLAKLPGDGFAAELSMEKISVLDVDVLMSYYNDDPATQKKIEGNKLFEGLDVVKRGSYVPLDLKSFWPLRTPTPLAVPYVIDNVVPKIAEAAAKAKSA